MREDLSDMPTIRQLALISFLDECIGDYALAEDWLNLRITDTPFGTNRSAPGTLLRAAFGWLITRIRQNKPKDASGTVLNHPCGRGC
jgi:hypothetical protein